MYKFLLILTVVALTACTATESSQETTADSTAVVDTVTVLADSTVVVDSTTK